MAFNMTTSGGGWRLAGSLIQLGHEIQLAYPQATCLGTVGNTAHEAEGDLSDHNPIVKDPRTGVGIVRAIDIGGPDSMLKQIRQRIWTLYAEQDPRLWQYGYSKGTSDNLINNFGLPFRTHVDAGDAGHLHISVTQSHYPSVASGYLPAIDSTAPWGFASVAPSGDGTVEVGMDEQSIASKIMSWTVPADGGVQPVFWVLSTLLTRLEQTQAAVAAIKPTTAAPTIDYTQLAAALIAQLKAA